MAPSNGRSPQVFHADIEPAPPAHSDSADLLRGDVQEIEDVQRRRHRREPQPSASVGRVANGAVDHAAPDYCGVAVQLPTLEESIRTADGALLAAMSDTDTLIAGDLTALNDAGTAVVAGLEALAAAGADARALTDDEEALEALDAYLAGVDDRYRPVAEVAAIATDLDGYLVSASPAIAETGELPAQARGVLDGYFAETCAINRESAQTE